MVTDEFRKIAVSFAGGDGGNPKSEVWFCGLEWGIGDESSPDDFYEKFSLSPKLIPHSWVEDDFDGLRNIIKNYVGFCGTTTI